jgi:deazaflavin-dependent oxidoreductase (nitroreductase family)
MTAATREHQRSARPLFGLRRQPGRLVLTAMRLPRPLYHRGFGWLLGHTFLLITHQGRKTGKPHETVAMALTYDPDTRETVVCSAWGPNTEWIRNLRPHPALRVQTGRESYIPEQRFLSQDEAVAVGLEFRDRHPARLRLFAAILGWGDLSTEPAMREFVRNRPFVSFRPAERAETLPAHRAEGTEE